MREAERVRPARCAEIHLGPQVAEPQPRQPRRLPRRERLPVRGAAEPERRTADGGTS